MTIAVAERGGGRPRGTGIGRAAVMIGIITVLARLVGFGRQVVFAHTVGTTCLGTAYTTANMVPNIIYDIVLGGALSSVVVPVLAGPAGQLGEQARQISSALLTWTVTLLVPVSLAVAVAARPIVSVLLSGASGCSRGELAGVGTRMLVVFAPQVLLYGLAVVLYGVLQSHRRFAAPALAPLVSSVVVVVAYGVFGTIGGAYVNRLGALPPAAEYLLSGGTTLGVLALVLTAVVPARRLRIGLRPAWRFPSGVGARVRRLAIAGVVTLVAQDASVAVVIVLANRYGNSGALVLYGFAWAVFVVPFAVLAVPIATSAFPELSARSGHADPGLASGADITEIAPSGHPADAPHPLPNGHVPQPSAADAGAGGAFDVTASASTRAVLVASLLGVAVLVGARVPLSRVFESHHAPSAAVLALSLAAFAPGLVGYGLSANLSRVLYAQGRNRAAALAVSAGWLLVIAADLVIVPLVPRTRVVPALGVGTSIGLTVAGAALLVLAGRARGAAGLAGVPRAFLAGLTGCAVAAAAPTAVAAPRPGIRLLPQRRDVRAGERRGGRGVRRSRADRGRRRPARRPAPLPSRPGSWTVTAGPGLYHLLMFRRSGMRLAAVGACLLGLMCVSGAPPAAGHPPARATPATLTAFSASSDDDSCAGYANHPQHFWGAHRNPGDKRIASHPFLAAAFGPGAVPPAGGTVVVSGTIYKGTGQPNIPRGATVLIDWTSAVATGAPVDHERVVGVARNGRFSTKITLRGPNFFSFWMLAVKGARTWNGQYPFAAYCIRQRVAFGALFAPKALIAGPVQLLGKRQVEHLPEPFLQFTSAIAPLAGQVALEELRGTTWAWNGVLFGDRLVKGKTIVPPEWDEYDVEHLIHHYRYAADPGSPYVGTSDVATVAIIPLDGEAASADPSLNGQSGQAGLDALDQQIADAYCTTLYGVLTQPAKAALFDQPELAVLTQIAGDIGTDGCEQNNSALLKIWDHAGDYLTSYLVAKGEDAVAQKVVEPVVDYVLSQVSDSVSGAGGIISTWITDTAYDSAVSATSRCRGNCAAIATGARSIYNSLSAAAGKL